MQFDVLAWVPTVELQIDSVNVYPCHCGRHTLQHLHSEQISSYVSILSSKYRRYSLSWSWGINASPSNDRAKRAILTDLLFIAIVIRQLITSFFYQLSSWTTRLTSSWVVNCWGLSVLRAARHHLQNNISDTLGGYTRHVWSSPPKTGQASASFWAAWQWRETMDNTKLGQAVNVKGRFHP